MNFYEESRKFALERVGPYAKRSDREGRFPVESFGRMGRADYFKLLIPEEMGGLGETTVEHQQAVLTSAESNPAAGLCYMMHNVALMIVLTNDNEELKKKVVKDIVENNKFMTLAYSEFGTSTHFYIPEIKVTRDSGGFIFNGTKSIVTSATHASCYLISTPSTKKEGDINNWSTLLEAEGLEFKMSHRKGIGVKGNVSCPMTMTDVKLDEVNRIGEEGPGVGQVFSVVVPHFILGLANVYTGLSLRLSKITNDYALKRKYPSGQCLANIETV